MSMIPVHMPPLGPSPSRNPFARPKLQHDKPGSGSFSRATLLPSILSPVRPSSHSNAPGEQLSTPADKRLGAGSSTKPRTAWRLLWRGGLEIGREGWRLDGITFFAKLSFAPPTPSASIAKEVNPFDVPIQPQGTPSTSTASFPPGTPTSPFPLTNGDTDLCLSLESMRGRKYLQVRGLIDLPEDEVLEGESNENDGGVQMSIAPEAALLAAYFTGLLCRSEELSASGRTLSAITIGLGDEDVDTTGSSTIVVYGQRQNPLAGDIDGQGILKLCVGRRKPIPPPPSAKKIRPGEPLPRAPLFFPAKAPKKPPSIFPSRSLSRTSSLSSSIYLPPQSQSQPQPQNPPQPLGTASTSLPHAASSLNAVSAPVSGRTPGRGGEKRPRELDFDEDDRMRKTGRIVLDRPSGSRGPSRSESTGMERMSSGTPVLVDSSEEPAEEDIFGKRASSVVSISGGISHSGNSMTNRTTGSDTEHVTQTGGPFAETSDPPSLARSKRVRVPQQVLDNKATIRKQCLVLLELRGIARTHEAFKDVFGMTTKGTYFAFRNQLEQSPLSKADIQRIVTNHLDMYMPDSQNTGITMTLDRSNDADTTITESSRSRDEGGGEGDSPQARMRSGTISLSRQVNEKEEYHEVKLEGTFFHHAHIMVEEGRVKLEAVEEEEEDE
ncbi:hypothetical protein IAU59_004168 [Kwoniella sp. CBS 9459]